MAFLIFLISALRYNVGWDYETYFEWAFNGLNSYMEMSMEPLSKGMLDIALYSGEPQTFFVMSSAVVVGLFSYSYIRCSPLPTLSILGFFCLPLLFLVSLAIVRQSMAAAVVFFALTVLEKRHISALVLLLLAGLLHYSAWIALLFWPFLRWFERPVSTTWYVAAMAIGPMISTILVGIIEPYLLLYSGHLEKDGTSGLQLILLYYLFAFLILYLRHCCATLPTRQLNFFMLGVVMLGTGGVINEVVGRLAYYFLPFAALLLPACIAKIKPHIYVRLLTLSTLGILLIMQIYIAGQNPEKDPYRPYQLYPGWISL
ncbi:EpsG family protein [Limnobacter sp. SAORIC-690]|uniref:EpsG family protein n=1 Tax=Limnobacter sp. SAORIC-690 TaxID=1923970 RepID=UPI001444120A|nr:EpsG family protein [Limnobacter sp. SAORIC-690]